MGVYHIDEVLNSGKQTSFTDVFEVHPGLQWRTRIFHVLTTEDIGPTFTL